MPRYYVITPPYECDCGSDVVEVEAKDKREAKVRGLQELRRLRNRWLQDQASDNRCPFTGLQVEKVEDKEGEA